LSTIDAASGVRRRGAALARRACDGSNSLPPSHSILRTRGRRTRREGAKQMPIEAERRIARYRCIRRHRFVRDAEREHDEHRDDFKIMPAHRTPGGVNPHAENRTPLGLDIQLQYVGYNRTMLCLIDTAGERIRRAHRNSSAGGEFRFLEIIRAALCRPEFNTSMMFDFLMLANSRQHR
jgi:hypothetical protein